MKPPEPDVVEIDVEQLEAKLDQIEEVMGEEIARPFRLLLGWYLSLLSLIEKKRITISRLRRLLFGPRTERTRDVVSPDDSATSSPDEQDMSEHGASDQDAGASGEPPTETPAAEAAKRKRPKRRGHGRIPAEAYTGCELVRVTHSAFRPGDCCPHCGDGTLYQQSEYAQVVRLKGQPPIGGTRYELERLRCGLCGKVETAQLPDEAGPSKYDPTVASTIATLRYGQGLPWKRIERIQQCAGIPLPASVQWEVVRDAAGRGLRTVYRQLLWEAAQGSLVFNDDTSMRVLQLTAKIKEGQPLHEGDPKRQGVFTTSILSVAEGRPTIALFFTGPQHAGENLRELLAKRLAGLPPPLQMCDALSRNTPSDLDTVIANCLSHGRRNFHELAEVFPSEVRYVLECLKTVYKVDARANQQQLSPQDRLRLHQEQSRPVMNKLHQWLQAQLKERKVEPNSSMGQAISYMLKHWEKLTLFLREPGAPLDNNICERALKMAIRHRKNSLFYKTLNGAQVGDLYMSLIHTCYFSDVDPFDYMTVVQQNHEQVAVAPADWLPWNYRQQVNSPPPSS